MKKPEAEQLAGLILAEFRQPADVQDLYDRIGNAFGESAPLARFLASKDRQHRRVFYLQSEKRWFSQFGWTLAKALMLFGLLAGAAFLLAGGRVTADQTVTLIFGASAFYVLVYFLSIRRHSGNARKIEEIRSGYRAELRSILDDLVREHGLDAGKYRAGEGPPAGGKGP